MYLILKNMLVQQWVAPAKNTESLPGVVSRQKSRLERVNSAIVNKTPVGRTAIHVMVRLIATFSDIDMFLLMCATCEDGKLYLGEFACI